MLPAPLSEVSRHVYRRQSKTRVYDAFSCFLQQIPSYLVIETHPILTILSFCGARSGAMDGVT